MAGTIPGQVRGIRAQLPPGTMLGRVSSGSGAAEMIPLASLAQYLANQPALANASSSANIQTLLDGISTTQGTILYYNGTDWVALTPGTSGDALTTGGTDANPSWTAVSANIQTLLNGISTTQGAIIYYNGTDWVALTPGTAGDVLTSQGSGANPEWATPGNLVSANLYNASSYSFTGADDYQAIKLGTVGYDASGITNTTDFNMTIPTAGIYVVSVSLDVSSSSEAVPYNLAVVLTRSGSPNYNFPCDNFNVASGGGAVMAGSIILQCDANDVLILGLDTAANCTVFGGTGADANITQMTLVGPLGAATSAWAAGAVSTVGDGLSLSSGTLSAEWQGGDVTTVGSGLTLSSGTLTSTGGSPWTQGGTYSPGRPAGSTFSWVNQNSATYTDNTSPGPLTIVLPAPSSRQIVGLMQTVPASTPWTMTAAFTTSVIAADDGFAGLGITDGTKFVIWGLGTSSGFTPQLLAQAWTNDTTEDESIFAADGVILGPVIWFRIENNGTDLLFSYSLDGAVWFQQDTDVAIGTYLGTMTSAGLVVESYGTDTIDSTIMNLWGFELTTGTGTNLSW